MIKVQNLSKKYGSKSILLDINLSFEKGRIYGIFGENGSGKTTLFKCISGLESHEGTVTSSFNNLKNHMGFLFTEPFFFSKMTGREYLQLHINARKQKTANFEENNIFNLPLNQYISTYSTGMKKKLALLAILLQKNDFLILDEPFNGVDIKGNFIISQLIKELKNKGKTIVISSHVFATLTELCDEIYWLKEGNLQQYGKEEFSTLKDLVEASSLQNISKTINAF